MRMPFPFLALGIIGISGCGAAPNNPCTLTPVLEVYPGSATASSTAAPPGNQQQFVATVGQLPTANSTGCAVPATVVRAYPAWTNPDAIHISISSAQDQTNGAVVCKGPTGGPVTLTASAGTSKQPLTATVRLTCN